MPNPAVPNFQNPDAYEQVMGRWSRRLAPCGSDLVACRTATACWMSAAGPAAWRSRYPKSPTSQASLALI
jgi:hypothetical protein